MPKLMDYVFDLLSNKNHLLRQDPANEKDYVPFVVNRALSMNPETILFANELNKNAAMPKLLQYDFLFHGIPQRRRQVAWKKRKESDDIKTVQAFYECSYQKATDMLRYLEPSDIAAMAESMDKGGRR